MRRTLLTLAVVVLLGLGLAGVALATGGGSAITQARLEDSVTASFTNVYSQEAALLGHRGVTPASMRARMYCNKGPGVPQSGPGASWICLTTWHDPAVPISSPGYAKLEVTVHANGCYTVGAPSTYVGYQTITSAAGTTVNNPAYAFDGCLDPNGDNTPNGVTFQPELKITSTTAPVDATRHAGIDLACGPGANGCAGSVTATAGGRTLGTVTYAMTEQATTHLRFPVPVPAGAKDVTYTAHGTHQVLPSAADLPIQG